MDKQEDGWADYREDRQIEMADYLSQEPSVRAISRCPTRETTREVSNQTLLDN